METRELDMSGKDAGCSPTVGGMFLLFVGQASVSLSGDTRILRVTFCPRARRLVSNIVAVRFKPACYRISGAA